MLRNEQWMQIHVLMAQGLSLREIARARPILGLRRARSVATLRAVQLLLGHAKLERTVRNLGTR